MVLSRQLRSTALVLFICLIYVLEVDSGITWSRPKRQNGANMFLPASSIIPDGEGDPTEWSDWGSPSECSRSCGGGVVYQTRECLRISPNGAPLCSGGNTRYYSCNTQDCPEEEPDFRSEQCARYNNVPFDGITYDWVPYLNGPNPCELNCMPRGERFYYKQKPKVIDGTRCNDLDLDVCVNGICQPVGCDMMLGSDAKEDKCKRCGGDGTTCKTISDTYKTSNLEKGYNDILLIPSGATNIRIQETEPSNNYLACRNLSSHFYLNGNWRIAFARPLFFAGCWWDYQRKPNGFAAPDQLFCSGPTTESLFIVMLVQDNIVSVDYEYSIPTTASQNTPDVYSWTHKEFSPCSATCGGGTQTRIVTCNNRINLQEVDSSLCDEKSKPSENQECGMELCAPQWVEGEWGKCSKGCGADGMQNRTVSCERTSSSGERTLEPDAVCLKNIGNKPATTQECNRNVKNCPKFHLGPWTPCDKLCGEGKQKRKVTCYIEIDGRKKILPEHECAEETPEIEKTCLLAPCEGVDWILSEWSGCNECGQSVETRTSICASKSGKVYPDEFCAPQVHNLTLSRSCKAKKCEGKWVTSEWSNCSASCGKGVQTRIAICLEEDGVTVKCSADDSSCTKPKPNTEQECEGVATECPGQWFTGVWGPCSKTCGGGERTREVFCLANGTKSLNCNESKIETILEKCNMQDCQPDSSPIPETTEEVCEDEEDEEVDFIDDGDLPDKKMGYEINTNPPEIKDDELIVKSQPMIQSGENLQETTTPNPMSILTTETSSTDATDSSTPIWAESTLPISTTSFDTTFTTEALSTDTTDSSTPISTTNMPESTFETTLSVENDYSTPETTLASSTTLFETTFSTEASSTDTTDSSLPISTTTVETTIITEDSSMDTTDFSTTVSSTNIAESTFETTPTVENESSTPETTSPISTTTLETTFITEASSTDTTDSSTPVSTSNIPESTFETTLTVETGSSTSGSTTALETTSITETLSTDATDSSTLVSTTNIPGSTFETTTTSDMPATLAYDSSTPGSTLPISTTTFTTENSSMDTTDSSSSAISETTESTTLPYSTYTTESSTESITSTVSTDDVSASTTDLSLESSTISSILTTTEFAIVSTDILPFETTETSAYNTGASESTSSESENTPYTFETITSKATKLPRCIPKKKICAKSTYGCCPDNKTTAKGPFGEGCKIPKTCAETNYGCCLDGVSPAQGKNHKGCPKSQCPETLFGCCPDKFTPAQGENNEGCPELTTLPPTTTEGDFTENDTPTTTDSFTTESWTTESTVQKSCELSEFGCCPDGKTEAKGENSKDCKDEDTPQDCSETQYGCCRDGRTVANSPDGEGCPSCTQEPFGCCTDNENPAHGARNEGCCLNSPYGCCPDNINSAQGPNMEGCSCESMPFGCCPDNKTVARGPNNDGCGCLTTEFGCCPDKITVASGPDFEGCPCHTMQFGCCPDGIGYAKGPHHYECDCSRMKFKCCPDDKTPAKGPNQEGCTCLESKYGCCPDGVNSAQGNKFEGCENVPDPIQKSCALPKSTGSCMNYTIKYFYDTAYGACAKFWYGGCEGNNNRFNNEYDCKETCQEYQGKERCFLPKNAGPCSGYNKKWYFNTETSRCEEFIYGGCYGTTNRFDSREECQNTCDQDESTPPCEQPMDAGPCEGNFERWYYDNETDVCRPFNYGGCKGNKNNHPTQHACNYNCRQPGVFKDHCLLPKLTGDCSEKHPRWFYSESDHKCKPFYYTGCGGNKNNFPSLESCEEHCPKQVVKDVCEIPAEVGECTNYTTMWYYDIKSKDCSRFHYGGCGGNDNKFSTEESCLARCKATILSPSSNTPPQIQSDDVCELSSDVGSCSNYELKWTYNANEGRCIQFYYGGCDGNGNRFESEDDCLRRCNKDQSTPIEHNEPPTIYTNNVCDLSEDAGSCSNYELKWTYNSGEGRCMQFYYGGCDGNGNRFDSENECLRRCKAEQPHPPVQTTPPVKLPEQICELETDVGSCYNYVLKWTYSLKEERCVQFYYGGCDGNANRFETESECLSRCSQPTPVISESESCFLAIERGYCNENITRWHYNSAEGVCDEFVYSGCGGNANNYETEEECQNKCEAVQTTCSLPPVPGRCNERLIRWYFDERSKECFEFEFSGCRGNRNNFVSQQECSSYCKQKSLPPQLSVCEQPLEVGECDDNKTAWYYNIETQLCTEFTFSGCGGNGNRFASKDQCDRQCGLYKGIDVCNEPMVKGSCQQLQKVFSYNKETRTCVPFKYGGCESSGNRFIDRDECESVCNVKSVQSTPINRDICLLPVNIGNCNGEELQSQRWYYDDDRGNCVVFLYSGCLGNLNNFKSYQACTDFCNPISNKTNCQKYDDECAQIRCPFGVSRKASIELPECTQCSCENPCASYQCPADQQCAVEVSSDASNQFIPICRDIVKPGECPVIPESNRRCEIECNTDADCRADSKCCSNSCGNVCVAPATPHAPVTPAPEVIHPGEAPVSLIPKKPNELDVETSVGGVAILRCFAAGSPPPNITWSYNNLLIDTAQGRFILTSSGDLSIVQVRQSDSGSYVCVAYNGLGEPVRREIQLAITGMQLGPKQIPAYIYGDKNRTQIVTLNKPAYIRCPAGGYPTPVTRWLRNGKNLALMGKNHEQLRDYGLILRSVQVSDLGLYICHAYNNVGRAASMKVKLKAYAPDNIMKSPYLIYPESPASNNQSPYPVVQRPVFDTQSKASAKLIMDAANTYKVGSYVHMTCEVDGYPVPNVTWTRNGKMLFDSGRFRITSNPHTLTLVDVTQEDNGSYGCLARNKFSYSSSEQMVYVKSSLEVPAHCIDSPDFANCKRIVQGKYCENEYFKKFCCRSCVLAGQISLPTYINSV